MLDNLDNLKKINEENNITSIEFFDLKSNRYNNLLVDSENFNMLLKQYYFEFLKDKFLKNFSWYNKMLNIIKQMLLNEFNETSDYIYNRFCIDITRIFLIRSNYDNSYEYLKTVSLMEEMFCVIGFDKDFSGRITNSFFSGLEKNNMIQIERNAFGFKKSFSLSDGYFDLVLAFVLYFYLRCFLQQNLI